MSDKKKREIYDLHGEEGAAFATERPSAAGNGANYANYDMPHGFSQAFFGGQQGSDGSFFSSSSTRRHRWFDGDSTGDSQFSDVFQDIMNNFMRGSARTKGQGGGGGTFFQQSTGRAQSAPSPNPETVVIPVDCTLRDLFSGRSKNLRVKDTVKVDTSQQQRHPLQQSQSTQQQRSVQIEKVFKVDIQPGYKKGTRIKYPASADFPKIVVFEVREVPHKFFTRRGNDLHWTCRLTSRQVQRGVIVKIPLLSGETYTMDSKDHAAIADGARVTLKGLGMPYTIRGVAGNRGDLVVKFDVVHDPAATAAAAAATATNSDASSTRTGASDAS